MYQNTDSNSSGYFFPRKLDFWLLHCFGCLGAMLINGYFSVNDDRNHAAEIAAQVVWFPLFTLCVLHYRRKYQFWKLNELSYWRKNFNSFGLGIFYAVLISFLILSVGYQFLSEEEILITLQENHENSGIEFAIQLLLGNSVFNLLLLYVWMQMYNNLVVGRRMQENEVYNLQLQNALKESQIANLTHQLNPHFLFNTLNNIKFMVRRDPLKTEKMITDLSDILRYSLESNKREKVTIADELEIVNRYISIIKVQMDNRLDFDMSVSESLYVNLIPPMILQLLIENSIKYGIDSLRHGGKVQLIAEGLLNKIRFTIINDIPDVGSVSLTSTGIGLANIEQRLGLLYGDSASFSVEEKQSRFVVTLTIPKESY